MVKKDIRLTITTRSGRVGVATVSPDGDEQMIWTPDEPDGDDPTEAVVVDLLASRTETVIEEVVLNGDEWRYLDDTFDIGSLQEMVHSTSLSSAIAVALDGMQSTNQTPLRTSVEMQPGNVNPVKDRDVKLAVIELNGMGPNFHEFSSERERSLYLSEQDATFDTFFSVEFRGEILDVSLASTGSQALEDCEESSLDVFVVAKKLGEDTAVAYRVAVSVENAVVPERLTDEQQGAIASIVEKCFLDQNATGLRTELVVTYFLANGDAIDPGDVDIDALDELNPSAEFKGEVRSAEIPFEVEGLPQDVLAFDQATVANVGALFLSYLRRDSGNFAAMCQRNFEEMDSGICHSHDFLDANVLMADAFSSATGIAVDGRNDSHTALWNQSWSFAKNEMRAHWMLTQALGKPAPEFGLKEAKDLFEKELAKVNSGLASRDYSLASFPRTGEVAQVELLTRASMLQWVLEMLPSDPELVNTAEPKFAKATGGSSPSP